MADELLCTTADVADAWPKFAALTATRQASLVSRASQAVLDHCRRGFIEMGVAEAKDGDNLSRLWLRRTPIISVSAVAIDGYALDNTSGDAWYFRPGTGELGRGRGHHDFRFGRAWPSGRGNIVVQYWGGYAAVPDPVVEATVWCVKWMSDRARISGIFQSESIGDYSFTLADQEGGLSLALPAEIAALLADYVAGDVFA